MKKGDLVGALHIFGAVAWISIELLCLGYKKVNQQCAIGTSEQPACRLWLVFNKMKQPMLLDLPSTRRTGESCTDLSGNRRLKQWWRWVRGWCHLLGVGVVTQL